MRQVLRAAHLGLLVALLSLGGGIVVGCAEATRTGGENDLSDVSNDASAIEDAGEDMAVETPDLQIVCDAGAGLRVCGGKCVTDTQCCMDSECPTPANGAPSCNNLNQCDVTCNANYKACNGGCIPMNDCCSDADCTTPGDPCKLVQGAKCETGVCNYPAVSCPYMGQFCDSTGSCTCPSAQHPCVTVGAGGPMGKCIADGTCCTNSDCSGVNGSVCPSIGGTCTCTAGFKKCTVSSSCIPQSTCCDSSECTGGQACSGAGGSCNCPLGQKFCAGKGCIAISACCDNTECSTAVSGAICQTPANLCGCPSGKRECDPTTGSPQCITNSPSVCCIDSDCNATLSGAKCSGIGGSCACPNNSYQCGTACINNANCCTSSDCVRIRNINGETCSAAGGTCSCPANTKECPGGGGAVGSCVSTATGRCCTSSDCSAPHVSANTCSSTFCSITPGGCSSGFVDVNGTYSDGCECADDGFGKSCGAATGLGNIGIGGSTSKSGVLPLAGEENWFQVTFNGSTSNNSYHPHITISSTGGDDVRFDVFNGSSCSAGTLSCPGEGGSAATNRTNWEVLAQPGGSAGAPGCGNTTNCNTCNCTSAFTALPFVGTVYIRVHRVGGSPTCNSYTVSVTG
jgi:hypothetical protein